MSRLWHTDTRTHTHVKVEQYSAEAESAILIMQSKSYPQLRQRPILSSADCMATITFAIACKYIFTMISIIMILMIESIMMIKEVMILKAPRGSPPGSECRWSHCPANDFVSFLVFAGRQLDTYLTPKEVGDKLVSIKLVHPSLDPSQSLLLRTSVKLTRLSFTK